MSVQHEAVEGQLNHAERELLTRAVLDAPSAPNVVLEVGTWLGGGSTLHLLRALGRNNAGHLWGIEADHGIYERMLANIRRGAGDLTARFTPLFGFSQKVIPQWLAEQGESFRVDLVFLDGGNNPLEQITEFELLAPRIPVRGQLLSHDAKLRKGKWLVPYVTRLDNWECTLHDVSDEGLFYAKKVAPEPSLGSMRAALNHLRRMRLQPAEIAAAILPSSVCGAILRFLPRRFSRRLSDGRY